MYWNCQVTSQNKTKLFKSELYDWMDSDLLLRYNFICNWPNDDDERLMIMCKV